MPKKATPARSGVQRTKPRAQKSFELVRPLSEVQERETEETVTAKDVAVETGSTTVASSEISSELAALPTIPKKKARSSSVATEVALAEPVIAKPPTGEVEGPVVAAKGSASARLAARKNSQRSSQRSSALLITAEHYSYVTRDLVFIAILAAIMFIAIIVLYFVLPGAGV